MDRRMMKISRALMTMKQHRVPTGAPLMRMSGLPTRMKLTTTFTTPPMITARMGRLTMPLAWRMELHSSWRATKMEARPSMDSRGPATDTSMEGNSRPMMGPPRANRPIPMGRASSRPTRRADSLTFWAPRWSCRARLADTAGMMQAVRGTIMEKGRL